MLSMEESGRDRPQDRVTLPPGIGRETNTEDDGETPSPRAPASSADHQRRDLTDKDRGDQHAEHGGSSASAANKARSAFTGDHRTLPPDSETAPSRAQRPRASSIDDATEERATAPG